MPNKKRDLTGKTFGRLTVIKESTYKNKTGRARWLCECECGDKCIIASNNLLQGGTRSCGCLKRDFIDNYYSRRRLDSKARSVYNFNRYNKRSTYI